MNLHDERKLEYIQNEFSMDNMAKKMSIDKHELMLSMSVLSEVFAKQIHDRAVALEKSFKITFTDAFVFSLIEELHSVSVSMIKSIPEKDLPEYKEFIQQIFKKILDSKGEM